MTLPQSWFRAVLIAGSILGAGGLRAQDPASAQYDPVVALPAYTVTDTRDLPPPEAWRHAEIPGFEILSNASDRETKRLIHDFQLFNQAIGVVWPSLVGRSPTPVSIILCGRGEKFKAFIPKTADAGPAQGMASLFLRNNERSAIVVDLQTRELGLAGLDTDFNASGVENNGSIEVDAYKQLYREYVHSLLARTTPRLAAWLEEGLAQLLMGMKVSPTLIEFAKLDDPNTVSIQQANAAQLNALAAADGDTAAPLTAAAEDRDFNAALQRTHLMSFPEMFAVKHEDPTARNSIGSKWAKQSTAFVHMCLYQTGQRFQKGFVTFIQRSAKEPVTEPMFKECFGIGYKDMLLELRGYLDFTNYKSLGWSSKKGEGLGEAAPLVLRDATEAEVGRIKGEAMLLADLKEPARIALITPYTRGERDPRLLAALGLYERSVDHADRARKFLEAAAAGKVVRPLAHLELARLRFQAVQTVAGPEASFTTAQTADISAPLLLARLQPPSMPEVYELLGDVYARSVDDPKPEIMAMLFEGVNLFPRRLALVYRTSLLCLRLKEFKGAAALIEHGLRTAPAGVAQTRFAELKPQLPPGAFEEAQAKFKAMSGPKAPPAKS
ncbi:MAG: hypothetical protein WCQ44_01705 [Opitutaceae bacterium]